MICNCDTDRISSEQTIPGVTRQRVFLCLNVKNNAQDQAEQVVAQQQQIGSVA